MEYDRFRASAVTFQMVRDSEKGFARIPGAVLIPSLDGKSANRESAIAQIGRQHERGIERMKSPLRLGDAPPLMRDQLVQHTAARTSGKTLKSWHDAPPSSPGISV